MDILHSSLKYIKTHLYYLLTKKNVIFLIILNILCLSYCIYISSIFDGIHELDANRSFYLTNFNNNYFFFIKIVYICFIIFINISYFGREYSKYSELFIKNMKTKIVFYITKYISIFLFIFLELFILFFIYFSIISLLPYGKFYISTIGSFIRLYLLGSFYLLLSSILLLIFKTYLASIISLVFYWFSFVYSSYNDVLTESTKILLLFSPFGEGVEISFIYGTLHILLYNLILILLNVFIIMLRGES